MRLSMSLFTKFGSNLKEMRIIVCQTGKESAGVREFINKHFVQIKQANPSVPILIRECEGAQPRLYARYGFGKEKSVSLTNATADDVLKHVTGHGTANF
ncbi:NADH dehydrogenase [ubiquinone] 1 alpha subcomplex subunit 2 [Culicoides brevitarsis]|uniref:NADH dehydrogenase [ubiquinone] 1 alpha subcomplex subunit 2 n=1 Tax=Culicoides brevitarsis TaxID=469753 RepID=UPI00307C75C1